MSSNMEEFKQKLNELLLQFPDLPEITLTIRPRISIDENKELKPLTSKGTTSLPNGPEVNKKEIPPVPVPKMDASRLAEMQRFSSIEQ